MLRHAKRHGEDSQLTTNAPLVHDIQRVRHWVVVEVDECRGHSRRAGSEIASGERNGVPQMCARVAQQCNTDPTLFRRALTHTRASVLVVNEV